MTPQWKTIEYPRLERGPLIEIPKLVNGRPSYKWVQGWIVKYSEMRESTPEKYNDAKQLLVNIERGEGVAE